MGSTAYKAQGTVKDARARTRGLCLCHKDGEVSQRRENAYTNNVSRKQHAIKKKTNKQKFRVAKGVEMRSEEIHFLANCSLVNVPCL